MISNALKHISLAVFSIFGLFVIGIAVPFAGPIVEMALAPGYILPEAYWGAAHDPLQLLVANLLNIAIYAVIFAVLAHLRGWISRRRHCGAG